MSSSDFKMEDFIKAIYTTPIIDNHAHPLLLPEFRSKHNFLSITTEAHGDAIRHAKSTLSHIRAVNQLSEVLNCPPTWDDVVKAIEIESAKPHHVWEKRCFAGIETVLVDDGLDGKDEVYDYAWHDKLCRSECKRIVRIEKVAEEIINELMKNEELGPEDIFDGIREAFEMVMRDAIEDPDVVGFKSVICYRTGLDIPPLLSTRDVRGSFVNHIAGLQEDGVKSFKRLDGLPLNAWLVNKAASFISRGPSPKKPLQFHTGLGDNDITLTKSSPSHLQEFIRKFPDLPIVLLHASYPWTKEAGYLASVYDNVYADIGEVFPFLSKEGQENVVREILELAPTEKILWSTDGHWFPETYLLAIIQVREALEKVLSEYIQDGQMTVKQAIRAVGDIFFNTSNNLYDLKLRMAAIFPPIIGEYFVARSARLKAKQEREVREAKEIESSEKDKTEGLRIEPVDLFTSFLQSHPGVKFLRLHFLDYTSTPRIRIIPIAHALSLIKKDGSVNVGITKASLGLLQNDAVIPGVLTSGEYRLVADFASLKFGPTDGYASVYGDLTELGHPARLCPRSSLRQVLAASASQGLEYLIGFEIEIVFMSRIETGKLTTLSNSDGHAWSAPRSMHGTTILKVLDEIYTAMERANIHLEMIHPESSTGQFEFVLPPYSPLVAADTVLHAREIITAICANHEIRATLYPKPFPQMAGTASHVHMSISSPGGDKSETYEPFWAGVLKHMKSIIAFTYSNPCSYDRMGDGCWAGGTWVAWGTQNKETALRKIVDSHFEIKVMDGLANVYLALAAVITSGMLGIEEKEKLVLGDCEKDPGLLNDLERKALNIQDRLPQNLPTALGALEADSTLVEKLGKGMVDRYIAVKKAEMDMLSAMEVEERKEWIMERY